MTLKKLLFCFAVSISFISISQNYGKLHFIEDFEENTNGWPENSDENNELSIKKGHYNIKHTNSETGAYYFLEIPAIDFDNEDFVLEAKIKQYKGVEDQAYGLRFCIYKDNSNHRDFYASSNGYFKINHYYSEKNHLTADWTKNTTIIKPQGEYNIFRVERKANILKYYLNNELVGYSANNMYFTNRMGFFLSGENEIQIDYMKIWTSPTIINFVENPLENAIAENLGSDINTFESEKAPAISPDGQTIYYSKGDPDADTKDLDNDIFYAELQSDGKWSKGINIGKPINNLGKNSVVAGLPDGNTLLLMNTYNSDGSSKGGGISMTKRNASGWEVPVNVKIEDYKNDSPYAGYSISPSGKVLISTSKREESIGERDLFVSFLTENGTWSKPKNMGSVINTFADEDTPFIASDDKTLYFSSEGHPGIGRADVFVSKRLDDTWTNWSTPLNLGNSINSTSADYGFIISAIGDYAYLYKYASTENGGFGSEDLFRIKLSESSKPEPIVFVKGVVFDSETKKPLAAEIIYEDLNSEIEIGIANSEPNGGKYQIALPYGKVYGFLAKKEGYYPISQNIDLSKTDELKTIIQDLYLTPIKKGVNIRLNNIFFENNKSELMTTSYTELDRLVNILKSNNEHKIEIGGHTDDVGSDSYNQTLSEARALSVMKYLIAEGISKDRLTYKGYGEKQPVDNSGTELAKAKNRRVEFVLK